jgi:hypothetical protein
LARTLARIVTGLYYHETGRILPKGYKPFVLHSSVLKTVKPNDAGSLHEIFGPLLSTELWRGIGGNAFGYAYSTTTNDPRHHGVGHVLLGPRCFYEYGVC